MKGYVFMNNQRRCKGEHQFAHGHHRGHKGGRRGPSSYAMHDSEFVFSELKLKEGDTFLDLGCGSGDYSIKASKIVGDSGVVYALDIWEELLDNLEEEVAFQGIKNIRTQVSDIKDRIAIGDSCIDICFIATVLHGIELHKNKENLFSEINRVLKPKGRLSIVNCKKEEQPFGPPLHMRLSPEEMESIALEYGFEKINLVDLGYNYMIQFGVK